MTVYSSVAVERLERRIEQLEAQLQTTRQALTETASALENWADWSQQNSGTVDRESREALASACRALADTGGDTAEDDKNIEMTVRYRDAWDTGDRLTIEELEDEVAGGDTKEPA